MNKPEGDKTLAFRCDRLLKNKILGESSSLFADLIIWETEYNQIQKFKELLTNLTSFTKPNPKIEELSRNLVIAKQKLNKEILMESWETKSGLINYIKELEEQITAEQPKLTTNTDEKLVKQITEDCEKLIAGRINYSLAHRFYFKWNNLINKTGLQKEIWTELTNYLKLWEQGKGAKSEWKRQLDIFKGQIDNFFLLGSENISDGQPFFQLGAIKEDNEKGLIIATQNRKGFNLTNPYVFAINFHQKYFRVYIIENHNYINPRNLYVELFLKEDWVWKDYPAIVHSLGSLNSSNHPIYQQRNLG